MLKSLFILFSNIACTSAAAGKEEEFLGPRDSIMDYNTF